MPAKRSHNPKRTEIGVMVKRDGSDYNPAQGSVNPNNILQAMINKKAYTVGIAIAGKLYVAGDDRISHVGAVITRESLRNSIKQGGSVEEVLARAMHLEHVPQHVVGAAIIGLD